MERSVVGEPNQLSYAAFAWRSEGFERVAGLTDERLEVTSVRSPLRAKDR
jgi:hypothetical protein